jgi:anti-sigma regulatory factor (Ser/Thr protein kinase)
VGPVGSVAGGAVRDKQAPQNPTVLPKALMMGTPGGRSRSAVLPEVATHVFRGHHDQVGHAREFVRQALGPVPVVDEAVLLVSELCTNALLHTASGDDGGTFEVAIYMRSIWLRVEVRDGGAGQTPVVGQPADTFAEGGRGLGLVELLADRWDHSGDRHGRSVFFELRWKEPD